MPLYSKDYQIDQCRAENKFKGNVYVLKQNGNFCTE